MDLRRLGADDDLVALTSLLHRAYARHAARGLRFFASYQGVETTRERAEAGECWVGVRDGQIVATVTVKPPGGPDDDPGCAWYTRTDIAKFGQLAVEPTLQGQGLGRRLLDLVERRARELGAVEISCDTAEGADDLRALYTARGYRVVDHADWRPTTNYPSVVYSLSLV